MLQVLDTVRIQGHHLERVSGSDDGLQAGDQSFLLGDGVRGVALAVTHPGEFRLFLGQAVTQTAQRDSAGVAFDDDVAFLVRGICPHDHGVDRHPALPENRLLEGADCVDPFDLGLELLLQFGVEQPERSS